MNGDPVLLAFLPLGFAGGMALLWFWWVRRVTDIDDARARWRYRQWSDPDDE